MVAKVAKITGSVFARDATTIVMFRVVAAHKVAIDFRDKLLATTQLGKRFVRHYEKNQSELLSVARKDRKLFEDCVNAWVAVAPFVNDMSAPPAAAETRRAKPSIGFPKKTMPFGWVLSVGFALVRRARHFGKYWMNSNPSSGDT